MVALRNSTKKRILARLYIASLEKEPSNLLDDSALEADLDQVQVRRVLRALQKEGLVKLDKKGACLTEKGRRKIRVVLTGGAFDIIHPGHIETLEKSKALGDVLVASVARNSTFERNKGRKPFNDESLRRKLVSSIRSVDAAVLGSESDILEVVDLLKPDIITLGYDQIHAEEELTERLKERGSKARVVRLTSSLPSIKTSKIMSEASNLLSDL